MAVKAGPQLVVPADNARYALNSANARWGSLYDALYGTDVISELDGAQRGGDYNPIRGDKVISFGRDFLDRTVPLKQLSHKDAINYSIAKGELVISLVNGMTTGLQDEKKFAGHQGEPGNPEAILLKNNGLFFEIQFDGNHPVGKSDKAGIKDIVLESALTTIMDCEDSVAAVDADDKVLIYRNWLGLMKGNLTASFIKDGKTVTRKLNTDRHYTSPDGEGFSLKGRSLMFVRNVGHLMTTNAVLNQHGEEVPEGILDTVLMSLSGKHALMANQDHQNSSKGSIYIVKPKMHGSGEVAFANELFFTGALSPESKEIYLHHHPKFNFDESAMLIASKTLTSATLTYLSKEI